MRKSNFSQFRTFISNMANIKFSKAENLYAISWRIIIEKIDAPKNDIKRNQKMSTMTSLEKVKQVTP